MINNEVIKNITNKNFSFTLNEDIYNRFRFPFDAVKPGSKIVIYGGGVVGKIFLQQIANSAYCNVVAVCDKNPMNTQIVEAPVINMAALAGKSHDDYDLVLIAIEKRNIAAEIREDLIMAGIPSGKIRWIDPASNNALPEIHTNLDFNLIDYDKALSNINDKISLLMQHYNGIKVFNNSVTNSNNNDNNIQNIIEKLGFAPDRRFEFPWYAVPKNSRLVIYGGGIVGKTFLVQVLSKKYVQLLAICDRKPENTGIDTVPVLTPNMLARIPSNNYDMVLVAIEREDIAEDIIDDLLDLDIPEEKIKWINPQAIPQCTNGCEFVEVNNEPLALFNNGGIFFGPYTDFEAGEYEVEFKFYRHASEQYDNDSVLCKFDVYAEAKNAIAERELRGIDFSSKDSCIIRLKFSLTQKANLEFRVTSCSDKKFYCRTSRRVYKL